MDSVLPETTAIANQLVNARQLTKAILSNSLPVPGDMASAMQIQALVVEKLARRVGGWKVAIGPDNVPVAAPLLEIYPTASDISLLEKCTIEVELAVILGRDLPRRTDPYKHPDIVDAIESVILGIEVIGSRFDGATPVPFLSFLADNLGNRAYIIGDRLPISILDQMGGRACHVTLNEMPLYQGPVTHPAGDPLLPLLAYANRQSDHLGGLKDGQVVTTGSICGVISVNAPGLLKAHLEKAGQVSIRFGV